MVYKMLIPAFIQVEIEAGSDEDAVGRANDMVLANENEPAFTGSLWADLDFDSNEIVRAECWIDNTDQKPSILDSWDE